MKACCDILRFYHFDTDNPSWKINFDRMIKTAPAFAARIESILSIYGKEIKRWAPKIYESLFLRMLIQLFLAREKGKAWKIFKQAFNTSVFSFQRWAIMVLGMASPSLLAYAVTLVKKWNAMRINTKQIQSISNVI
jgi:hypothetical protein